MYNAMKLLFSMFWPFAIVYQKAKTLKTAISLHSQSLDGSTGLPEDSNQTK